MEIKDIVKRPTHVLAGIVRKLWFLIPDDKLYLRIIYRLEIGHPLDLKNPKSYTEKIQWLKLYNRKPEYTTMVDKIAVKEYVAGKIGEEYVIPTLGVWNHFDEIDFSILPDKFVLKTNHGSGGGGVFICRGKNLFDFENVRKNIEAGLKRNAYNKYREWPYKNVRPKILAEVLIEDNTNKTNELNDYKFYCFNGEPKVIMFSAGRFNGNLTFDYYDTKWHKLNLEWDRPNSNEICPCPKNLEKMLDLCRKLAEDIPHVRVDLYNVNGKEYFGEMTFFDNSGYNHFKPESWNKKLGDMIVLPSKDKIYYTKG